MKKVHIKRIKRQKKPITTKEKLLAGFGMASALGGLGAGGISKPPQPTVQNVGRNKSSETEKIKSELNQFFSIPKAKADSEGDDSDEESAQDSAYSGLGGGNMGGGGGGGSYEGDPSFAAQLAAEQAAAAQAAQQEQEQVAEQASEQEKQQEEEQAAEAAQATQQAAAQAEKDKEAADAQKAADLAAQQAVDKVTAEQEAAQLAAAQKQAADLVAAQLAAAQATQQAAADAAAQAAQQSQAAQQATQQQPGSGSAYGGIINTTNLGLPPSLPDNAVTTTGPGGKTVVANLPAPVIAATVDTTSHNSSAASSEPTAQVDNSQETNGSGSDERLDDFENLNANENSSNYFTPPPTADTSSFVPIDAESLNDEGDNLAISTIQTSSPTPVNTEIQQQAQEQADAVTAYQDFTNDVKNINITYTGQTVGNTTPADVYLNGQVVSGSVVQNSDGTYKVLDSNGNNIYNGAVTVNDSATQVAPIGTLYAPSGTLNFDTPAAAVPVSNQQTTDLTDSEERLSDPGNSDSTVTGSTSGTTSDETSATVAPDQEDFNSNNNIPATDTVSATTASHVNTTDTSLGITLNANQVTPSQVIGGYNTVQTAAENLANAQPTASQVNTTTLTTPAASTDGDTSQQQVDAYIASQQANGVTISKNSDGSYTSYKATSDGQDIVDTVSADDMSKMAQQDILNNLPVASSLDKAVVSLPLDLKTSGVLGGVSKDAVALEAGVTKGISRAGSAVTNTFTNLEHKVGINVNPNAVDGTKTGITDPTQGPAVRLNDSDTPGAGTPLYKISNDTYVDDSGYVYKQPNSTQNSYVYTGLMMDNLGNLYNANDVGNSQQQTTMMGPGGMALKSLGNGIFANPQTGDLYDYDQDGNKQAIGVKMDSNGNLNSTPLVNGSDDATANKSLVKDLKAAGTGAASSATSLNPIMAGATGLFAGIKAATQSQSTAIYNWATNPANYNIPGEITYIDKNGQQETLDKFTVQKMVMGVTPKSAKAAINNAIKGN
jgi:hypothetical protein